MTSHSQIVMNKGPVLPNTGICLPTTSCLLLDLNFFFFKSHLTEAYPSNVAASSPNTTHSNTNSPSRLRDQCTLLQSVINAFNAVIFHTQKETTTRRHKNHNLEQAVKQELKNDYIILKQEIRQTNDLKFTKFLSGFRKRKVKTKLAFTGITQ